MSRMVSALAHMMWLNIIFFKATMFLQEVQLCLKALKHFLEINMNMMGMWGTRRNKNKLIPLKVEKIKPQFECLPL